MINVSVIIVSYNTRGLILKCIKSVKKFTKAVTYEVVVIDNASTDDSVDAIARLEKVKLIKNEDNKGFGAANNQGIEIANGEFVLLLNPDTELVEDSISKMVEWMRVHKEVGISSCQLINSDKTLQPTGGFFPNIGRVILWSTFIDDLPFVGEIFGSYHPNSNYYKKERSLDWVTGAFFLMRREVIRDVKGFDEDFFLYVEEVDLCHGAKKKGWEVRYVPITSLIHHKGASGTTEGMITREFDGLKTFYGKHYGVVEQALLRLFLFVGCLVRIVVFGIMNTSLAKIYAKAITKI